MRLMWLVRAPANHKPGNLALKPRFLAKGKARELLGNYYISSVAKVEEEKGKNSLTEKRNWFFATRREHGAH